MGSRQAICRQIGAPHSTDGFTSYHRGSTVSGTLYAGVVNGQRPYKRAHHSFQHQGVPQNALDAGVVALAGSLGAFDHVGGEAEADMDRRPLEPGQPLRLQYPDSRYQSRLTSQVRFTADDAG